MHRGFLALLIATIVWLIALFSAVIWELWKAKAENVLHTSLVFLIDGSGSVDSYEWQAQVNGYVAVLSQDAVQQTLEGVEVAVVFYGEDAAVACGWGTAQETALCLLESDRGLINNSGTCPSAALELTHSLLAVTETPRKVVDVSGDGVENCFNNYDFNSTATMPTPARHRDRLIRDYDAEINALAIINDNPDLAAYYEREIISELGFVIELAAYEDFVQALRAKIILEVAGSCSIQGPFMKPPKTV